jgi:hypothetical protein
MDKKNDRGIGLTDWPRDIEWITSRSSRENSDSRGTEYADLLRRSTIILNNAP